MSDLDVGRITQQLRRIGPGYWYPPDAIRAVAEGRDTYHPLDPSITYRLGDFTRRIIREAIEASKV